MIDDLVDRLQNKRVCSDEGNCWNDPLCLEAADRIEKDAQHIDEMYELVAAMNADHTASKTRIEKLEAALRKYADEEYNGYNADGAHARKALEGKDG